MKKLIIILSTLLLSLALIAGCTPKEAKKEGDNALDKTQEKAGEAVDMRSLREVAKDDKFENCNSCHKKEADKDVSLEAEAKNVQGHPPVAANATYATCTTANCHGSGDLKTRFVNKLHNKHASSETFRPKLKGDCVSCHELTDTGEIKVKG